MTGRSAKILVAAWIFSAVVIASISIIEIWSAREVYRGNDTVPSIRVDGNSAFVIKRVLESSARSGNDPLWVQQTIDVVRVIDRDVRTDVAEDPSSWRAIKVNPPYQIVFELHSGRRTESLDIDWMQSANWSNSGTKIDFRSGLADTHSRNFEIRGRQWNRKAAGKFVLWRFGVWLLAGVILLVIFLIYNTVHEVWFSPKANYCPICGYDLQGNLKAGCPECGTGRTDQAPPDSDSVT